MEVSNLTNQSSIFTCELEDWFHILGSDKVPPLESWSNLPLSAERNVEQLLQLLEDTRSHATFFCLGWMAERFPQLVRKCKEAGHEICSHGYGHVLAYAVGRSAFRKDIVRAKKILEDIISEEVIGFRCPGFSVKSNSKWVFDVVAEAGYKYDASVFPAHHGHGGLCGIQPGPHIIETVKGPLVEIPVSTVRILGCRLCLFGGGYLRITPLPLIKWGIKRLYENNQPLIVYVHPREIDPDHPRLPLSPWRRFKCYINLPSTMPKLKWMCEHFTFITMAAAVEEMLKSINVVDTSVASPVGSWPIAPIREINVNSEEIVKL
jgi:polysaccharide deacetylase family protein (PEP-CTERM system associated)